MQLKPMPGLPVAPTLFTHDPETDLVSRALHRERCWEPFESRLLLACMTPGCTAVDVGANIGYFSLLFAHAEASPGQVVAFEPARDNYALLARNIAANACEGRVEAVHAALSDRRGEALLHLSGDNLGDHVLFADERPRTGELVTLLPGAEALAPLMDCIDVLKIDTQGTELAVLRGLAPLLVASRDAISILVELTPAALRRAGDSGAKLIDALEALDLPLFIVDHAEHRVVPESADALRRWCDNVDATAGDEGFMNIFAGRLPAGF